VSPASVTGGTVSPTGTVRLNGPAPAGGAPVTLSSSNPAVATVAGSVTVAAGATSATFPISTSAVATSTAVTISGSYGSASQMAALPAVPPRPSSERVSPASVTGATVSPTGTVRLNGPAPAGDAPVTLSSSNPAVATMAGSVTVAA